MTLPLSSKHARTIVVATSSPFELEAMQIMLGPHKLAAQLFSRGDQALEAVADGSVAMVLLDVTLAGSASFELCQHLCRAATRPLPVLLMSAAPNDDERRRAAEAGAAGYIGLPLPASALAERILRELGLLPPQPASTGNADMATLEVNYHAMMAGSPDAVLLLELDGKRMVDVNRAACRLFGLDEQALLARPLLSLCPPTQPDGRPSADSLADLVAQALAGQVRVFHATFLHSSGRQIDCEMRMVPLPLRQRDMMHVRIVDVTSTRLAETLRNGKNELLEMIAAGRPLHDTLDKLTRLIEGQSGQVICTVLLLSPDGRTMRTGAGPSMPPAYLAQIDGLTIGEGVGSCGTAMARKQSVVVADIMNDPLWAPYRAIAADFGLRACWAMPILFDRDTVLGSFAMYYSEVRSPTAAERELIHTAGHLAGIAIARTRREEELLRHREHLEELVQARTAELQQAKDEAEHANDELTTALANLSMTQDELVRRDKLAALGALVAGVAHELNTPIGNSLVIASGMAEHTETLKRDLEGGLRRSVLDAYLERAADADAIVVRNLKRAARLVDSFKRIAVDAGSAQRRRFLLDEVLSTLLEPLQAAHRDSGLVLIQDIATGLAMDSYPGPLEQVVNNLVENSLVHGFHGGPAGSVTIWAHATEAGEIALSVSDDGAGIAAAHLARIYDPFFTTRLGAGGSGLGLYIVHNIVTGVLGGRIEVHSTEGQGCSFTMLLPPTAPL